MIYDNLDAHLKDNVLNSIQAGGLKWFELTDCLVYVFVGEVVIHFEGFQVGNCWDGRGGGEGKEDLGQFFYLLVVTVSGSLGLGHLSKEILVLV